MISAVLGMIHLVSLFRQHPTTRVAALPIPECCKTGAETAGIDNRSHAKTPSPPSEQPQLQHTKSAKGIVKVGRTLRVSRDQTASSPQRTQRGTEGASVFSDPRFSLRLCVHPGWFIFYRIYGQGKASPEVRPFISVLCASVRTYHSQPQRESRGVYSLPDPFRRSPLLCETLCVVHPLVRTILDRITGFTGLRSGEKGVPVPISVSLCLCENMGPGTLTKPQRGTEEPQPAWREWGQVGRTLRVSREISFGVRREAGACPPVEGRRF